MKFVDIILHMFLFMNWNREFIFLPIMVCFRNFRSVLFYFTSFGSSTFFNTISLFSKSLLFLFISFLLTFSLDISVSLYFDYLCLSLLKHSAIHLYF